MAYIEKRGKDVVVMGPGGEKRFKHKSEEEARSLINRINFLRNNNEKNGGSRDHLYEPASNVRLDK